jgi:uncharacterized protein with GYD domain
MPRYLIRVSLTPDAWATLVKNPQDRREAIRPAIEALGGKLEAFYYAFGEADVFITADMPDNVSAAAFAMAATAGGALSSYTTTVLMTVEEAMEAMRKTKGVAYRPPS